MPFNRMFNRKQRTFEHGLSLISVKSCDMFDLRLSCGSIIENFTDIRKQKLNRIHSVVYTTNIYR